MRSSIETGRYWDRAWSLVDNCTPVSEGCRNCWLKAMDKRFHREGPVTFRADRLDIPLKVKKPTVFSIWSDLFHEAVTDSQITNAISIMGCTPHHRYMVLTKRPDRMLSFFQHSTLMDGGKVTLPNLWLGVTAENQEQADKRIPLLLHTPAAHKFLSVEPMLEHIGLAHHFPHVHGMRNDRFWVVMGAETGAKRRPMSLEWARSIRDQCAAAGVPLWIKALDYTGPNRNNVSHDMAEWPEDLRIRGDCPADQRGEE